ncbi:MAG: hypothetical protein PHV18_13990 [Lachnospiraceae bacterium]|nr:hypothetical protein [Lachnospiraceae bacterium]
MLKQSMEEIGRLSRADIAAPLKPSAETLSAAQKITACRIACEAAKNGNRHGQADKISVCLSAGKRAQLWLWHFNLHKTI